MNWDNLKSEQQTVLEYYLYYNNKTETVKSKYAGWYERIEEEWIKNN